MLAQNKKPAAKKTKPAAKTGKKNQNTETESKYMLTEQDMKIKSEIKLLLSLALMALLFISNFGLLPCLSSAGSYFSFHSIFNCKPQEQACIYQICIRLSADLAAACHDTDDLFWLSEGQKLFLLLFLLWGTQKRRWFFRSIDCKYTLPYRW